MKETTIVHENVRQTGSVPEKFYRRRTVAPPIDVFENPDELLIVADVPGAQNAGIELRVENGTLALEARRGGAKDESLALGREYDEVDFAATFRIPAGIDAGAITAETKQGTLLVRLPKGAAAKPRRIEVRSNPRI